MSLGDTDNSIFTADQPSKEEDQYCIDCQNVATNSSREWETFKCMAPENKKGKNFVTGQDIYELTYCKQVRHVLAHSTNTNYSNHPEKCPWFKRREVTPTIGGQEGFTLDDAELLRKKAADRLQGLRSKKLTNEDLKEL